MESQERRRFFRITDSLKLSYRELSEEELVQQDFERLPQSPVAALFGFDKRIQEIIKHFDHASPELAELVGLLNKKIDSVIELLAVESGLIHRVSYQLSEVNVSACGMGFESDENFAPGAAIFMDIVLTPSDTHIVAIGRVISSIPLARQDDAATAKESYYLRVDFERIASADQELLIQHLVKRQLVLYREKKDAERNAP